MQQYVVEALRRRFAALGVAETKVLAMRATFRSLPLLIGAAKSAGDARSFAFLCDGAFRWVLRAGVETEDPELGRRSGDASNAVSLAVQSGFDAAAAGDIASDLDVADAYGEQAQLDFLMIEGGSPCPFDAPPGPGAGALSAAELRALPVWSEGAPSAVAEAWGALKERLLAFRLGFEVWTDWYERRFDGWFEITPWERAWAIAPPVAPKTA